MPFVNKEIDLGEFMKQLHQRIQKTGNTAVLIFFESFWAEQLPEKIKRAADPSWDGRTVNAGDFDEIYPIAARMLRDAASRNFSEAHPQIYEEAHEVSIAFCDELNELFQCSGKEKFDLIPIKSFAQSMAEAGLVKIDQGPDGQGNVTLTDRGEKLAEEFEQDLKKSNP